MTVYAPSALTKGVMATFAETIALQRPLFAAKMATVVQSDGSSETYSLVGDSPIMREIDGTVRFDGVTDQSYTLTNKEYANGLKIKRKDVRDDRSGILKARVQDLAKEAYYHQDDLLFDQLVNGTSATLGLDAYSEAFFKDAHAARGQQSGTQDNLLAGTGTTAAALQTDLSTAISAMGLFKNHANQLANKIITELTIVAPMLLVPRFQEVIHFGEAAMISQTSNVGDFLGIKFNIIPLLRAGLSDTNDWYLLNTSKAIKPLLLQIREPLHLMFCDSDNDCNVVVKHEYIYSVHGSYTVGYGFWWDAVKTTNT